MNLASLASILVNIIAPIVLVAAVGYLLAKKMNIEARPLSRTMLYFFTPALVFSSMYHADLNSEYISIGVFACVITGLMILVSWAIARVMRYDRLTSSGFMLGVLFVNAGNYGLPLILFAYGGRASARDALLNVFKLPLVYAVFLGLVFNLARITIPEFLLKSVDLAKDGAIPTMLVILGIELARATIGNDRLAITLATVTKLLIVPMVAFPLAAVMGLTGVTRAVCIIEASMPTAVMASIVAVEFDARPQLVTSIIFATTLASIVTLTMLLGILK